jgi:aminopeptidase N
MPTRFALDRREFRPQSPRVSTSTARARGIRRARRERFRAVRMNPLAPRDRIRRILDRIETSIPAHRAASRFGALSLVLLALACHAEPLAKPAPRSRAFEVPPARAHAPEEAPIDVEHYALAIDLDPAARAVHAVCKIRFVARRDALRDVALDFEGLDVQSVSGERGEALAFARSGGALHVTLAAPLARGDAAEISIAYAGRPQKGLWFARERAGVATQVFTQGECEDARWWFPCVDRPSERATSEIRVTMPKSWIAVAAGERIDRVESDDRATEHWRMNTPHPAYLTTLVAGELVVKSGTFDGVPLVYLAPEPDAQWIDASFADTADVLAYFSEITGKRYPYAKYSQACVDNFPFGGMENISATTLTDSALEDERGARDSPMTGLVAHEAAHQWFGDLLTCNDWSHIWLNEGFATYLGALYTEHHRGVDEMRIALRDMQEAYVANDVGAKRRPMVYDVYRDPMDLFFSGHTYQGGAVRLHLLRFVLGDAAFFRGLKIYVGRNAGRGVVTADLRRAMEEATHGDLGWFFDGWFAAAGFPEFQVAWKYDTGRKQVLLTVNQVQNTTDGTPAAFRSPVDVEVRDAHGVRTVRLEIERRRHLFEIPETEEPVWVRFDAHGFIPKVLDEKKSAAEQLAIASECDDVNARRDALRALGRDWDSTNGERERQRIASVLFEKLASDPCAAVRAGAASAMSALHRPDARDHLCDAAANDPEARVRVAALESLKSFDADAKLADFALAQYRAGYSWNTMASAAGLYRKQHPDGAYEWLAGELAVRSPHGELESRLIAEIADLAAGSATAAVSGNPRAIALLRAIAKDESEAESARVAAVRALGRIGRGQPEVRAELGALLATRSWRLRRETIASLGAFADPESAALLESYYRTTVFPTERRAIESFLERAPLGA